MVRQPLDRWELAFLMYVGRHLPKVPHASGVVNRLLKPLYLRRARGLVTCDVLGRRMELDPAEAVDGNLIFCPQLYDAAEIRFLLSHLSDADTFVDIGSHKGFYSLMASRRITTGRILAVEADPQTFASLRRNIELNHLAVTAVHCGVSDREEMLPLNVQVSGNRSGSSFLGTSELQVTVACRPLAKIVDDTGLLRITCMKLDIEGFEHKVLKSFFEQANPDLHPRYIITELHPDPSVRTGDLLGLLTAREYEEVLGTGLNRIFCRRDQAADHEVSRLRASSSVARDSGV